MIFNELFKRIFSSIILLPIVVLIIVKGSYYFNIFLILCLLISIFEWCNISKSNHYKFFGIFFLIISFYTAYKIRSSFYDDYHYILFVTIVCVLTDIGGFLFGKLFQGPKLTKLSPNKTYSGMIGSFILPILLIYLSSKSINFFVSYMFAIEILILTIMISTVSQLGDIFISYFKRISKLKDTGNIIPGHGGLLDRIDGMIFAFPFYYIYILITDFNFIQ